MTDPTADAIAALTKIIAANDRYVADTQPAETDLLTDAINEATPVLQALLSAQGQAGKPVATDAMAREALGVYLNPDDANLSQLDDMRDALNAALVLGQPQPAAGATDARALAINATAVAKILEGNWPDVLTIRQAAAHLRELAAIINPSALATIKGLET